MDGRRAAALGAGRDLPPGPAGADRPAVPEEGRAGLRHEHFHPGRQFNRILLCKIHFMAIFGQFFKLADIMFFTIMILGRCFGARLAKWSSTKNH